MEFLSKLRESSKIVEILDSDGHRSAPTIVRDYETVGATAITNTRSEGPTSFRPLPFITSLREVSSQLQAFQATPETPDGTACSSALNAARQISYWSSVFISMMEGSNPGQPTSTTLPSTLSTSTPVSASSTSSVSTSSVSTSASTSSTLASSASTSSTLASSASTSSTLASSASTSSTLLHLVWHHLCQHHLS